MKRVHEATFTSCRYLGRRMYQQGMYFPNKYFATPSQMAQFFSHIRCGFLLEVKKGPYPFVQIYSTGAVGEKSRD